MPSLNSKLCQGQAIRKVELQHQSSETTTGISQATKPRAMPERSTHANTLPSPSPHDPSPYSNSPTQGHVESGLDAKASVPSFAAALERPSRSFFVEKGRH